MLRSKVNRKLQDYLHRCWSKSSIYLLELMITCMACDFLVGGGHAVGSRLHHHAVITNQIRIKRALTDGAVIHPTVSRKARHDFASRIAQVNSSLPKTDRVTPSLVIAQAALESDWGQSPLYKEANNPFGMKGSYNGQYMMYSTNEFNSKGKEYSEMSDWKSYPSLADAVKDHNKFLLAKFLPGVSKNDYVAEAKALQNNKQGTKYATDPNYAQKIMSYIQNNDLTRFD